MALQAVHNSIDEIPEQFRELYTEKNGKYELTGVVGIKTQADIDRVQATATKAQNDLNALQDKFQPWSELDYDETMGKLDRIPELEAAAADKLDEAGIEEIVTRRVQGTINSQVAPLERQIAGLKTENETLKEENFNHRENNRQRKITTAVRKALVEAKVVTSAIDDALLLAERVFTIRDDGAIVTKDQVGVTPGESPEVWIQEVKDKKEHWWPMNVGGGAGGSSPGFNFDGDNPWSAEHWNMTKQNQFQIKYGAEKAAQMAKAAGTKLGGLKPPPKK